VKAKIFVRLNFEEPYPQSAHFTESALTFSTVRVRFSQLADESKSV